MNSPNAVANQFLSLAAQDRVPLSPMKLIKLVYIAHGYSLAILNQPLINEHAEAWRYGPVVPSLYHSLKQFGNQPIQEFLTDAQFAPSGTLVLTTPMISDEREKTLISAVWKSYKHLSAIQLSELTHRKGTPWYSTYFDKHGQDIRGTDIANADIKQHYEALVAARRANKPVT